MQEYDACVAAGLDLKHWEDGTYPAWFKANVLVWHETVLLRAVHRSDAIAEAEKLKARRKK